MQRILAFFDFPFTNISEESNQIPYKFSLDQNYPNPFNSSTTIKFSIATTANVKLKIYDMLGREAVTLIDRQYKPGNYEIKWNSAEYASGIYFYEITAGEYSKVRKSLLLK